MRNATSEIIALGGLRAAFPLLAGVVLRLGFSVLVSSIMLFLLVAKYGIF